MVAFVIGETGRELKSGCVGAGVAAGMGPQERIGLSVRMLARAEPVTKLAERHGVSRKFLYAQAGKAEGALSKAFAPAAKDPAVLFYLPVTDAWIRQFVVAQALLGHSSFRGVQELLRDLLDHDISLGTIGNILREIVEQARKVNAQEDLSGIRVGAHDEIYQAGSPVLVGADIRSTYCYLLSAEESCDETTWGLRLLELAERGLAPDHTVADGGRGLRAGQKAAWPGVACHGDVFHGEMDFGDLVYYLENRARGWVSAREKLERRMERAKVRGKGGTLSKRLAMGRAAEKQAVELARDIRTLYDWMCNDILSLAGPDFRTRVRLFDYIVRELLEREKLCPHRIEPVRRKLQNGRDELLAFAKLLDEELEAIAERFRTSPETVRAICELQGGDPQRPEHWQRRDQLYRLLPGQLHQVEAAVIQAMREIARASSIVENLNSRLRCYFFLRRHLSDGYLDLLRFFLNHHRFLRSARHERVKKSPAEALTGQPHDHWLELLGFKRFKRQAA
jgi:hypothetical protein